MKKARIILFFVVLLISCNFISTPSPLSSPMPVNTVFPTPSFTPEPTQTNTPILSTLFSVSRFSFITLNSITSVPVAELLYDKWIVGNEGLIFRYNVDAGYFSLIDTPVRENLYDVEFVSLDDGWIVGKNSLILHWNGENWAVSKPANASRYPYYYDLYSVAFSGANDGWAAGCTGSEGGEYFLVYHWDGTVWSEISVSDESNLWACAHDISVLASNDVWITGTGWESGKEYGITVHWDGNAWEIVSELASYNIQSLSALSSDNIWAITRYGIVLHWNGTEWSEVTQLDSVGSFSIPIIIYAQRPDDVFVASNKVWHWDGKDWTDISVSSNIEADSKIVDMVGYPSPAFPLETWMLDSSGMIYTFQWRD